MLMATRWLVPGLDTHDQAAWCLNVSRMCFFLSFSVFSAVWLCEALINAHRKYQVHNHFMWIAVTFKQLIKSINKFTCSFVLSLSVFSLLKRLETWFGHIVDKLSCSPLPGGQHPADHNPTVSPSPHRRPATCSGLFIWATLTLCMHSGECLCVCRTVKWGLSTKALVSSHPAEKQKRHLTFKKNDLRDFSAFTPNACDFNLAFYHWEHLSSPSQIISTDFMYLLEHCYICKCVCEFQSSLQSVIYVCLSDCCEVDFHKSGSSSAPLPLKLFCILQLRHRQNIPDESSQEVWVQTFCYKKLFQPVSAAWCTASSVELIPHFRIKPVSWFRAGTLPFYSLLRTLLSYCIIWLNDFNLFWVVREEYSFSLSQFKDFMLLPQSLFCVLDFVPFLTWI